MFSISIKKNTVIINNATPSSSPNGLWDTSGSQTKYAKNKKTLRYVVTAEFDVNGARILRFFNKVITNAST